MKSKSSEALLLRLMRVSQNDPLLPEGLLSIWAAAGPEFQAQIDLAREGSSMSLWRWWVAGGRHDFPGLRSELDDFLFRKLHWDHYQVILASLRKAREENAFSIAAEKTPELTSSDLISPLGKIVYDIRRELRDVFNPEDIKGVADFNCWVITHGIREHFGSSPNLMRSQAINLLKAVSVVSEPDYVLDQTYDKFLFFSLQAVQTLLPSVPYRELRKYLAAVHLDHLDRAEAGDLTEASPLLKLIYRNRQDLQNAFDLSSPSGVASLWKWWLSSSEKEYFPDFRSRQRLHNWSSALTGNSNSQSLSEALQPLSISDLNTLLSLGEEEKAALLDALHFNPLRAGGGFPSPLHIAIYRNRPDLQSTFNLDTAEGLTGLLNWWHTQGLEEYPIVDSSPTDTDPNFGSLRGISSSGDTEEEKKLSAETAFSSLAGDTSLVGYPRGEFGLGEDIRLLRNSLQTAGIEPNVIKAPWQIVARQAINEQAQEADVADFDSDVMVYVMPPFDTLTLLNKVGPRAFSARRKIGYWQWELDRFPEPAKIAFDLIDEVWCHSEHSARAFRSATDKPVTKVPLPVLVPEIRKVPRSTFGMDDDSFIIFTSFDGASSISRKNPMGVILAFQQAFPRKEFPHARLIVKAMNTIDDALWRDCLRKAAIDHRIEVLNKVLDRSEYYELLRCCDAVLSLHRAEGFGRLMAEAMAIGIPVIATAYSGNLDFMTEENSWLVPGELSPLIPGDYPFHQGQEWMEPDVDKAAEALRDCYGNPDKRKRLVANAKVTIERYSPAHCGRLYAELLARKT